MEHTKIEWADHTANFWSGCTKVSPGCANCYAATLSKRAPKTLGKWGTGAPRVQHKAGPEMVRKLEKQQAEIVRCANLAGEHPPRRPRIFVNSLSDWLDPEVPVEWLAELLATIDAAPHLDFLLLTKRPQLWRKRIKEAFRRLEDFGYGARDTADVMLDQWLDGKPPHNVWIGTTVEDQQRADERIPQLLKIPARVRFLSCEPLLGPVDLNKSVGGTLWLGGQRGCEGTHHHAGRSGEVIHGVLHTSDPTRPHHHHDERCGRGIDWVICGGESGHGARPMHPAWARSLRDQCSAAGVPFFFKQWGEWAPGRCEDEYTEDKPLICMKRTGETSWWAGSEETTHNHSTNYAEDDQPIERVGKRAAGRLLDGKEWSQFPEVRP